MSRGPSCHLNRIDPTPSPSQTGSRTLSATHNPTEADRVGGVVGVSTADTPAPWLHIWTGFVALAGGLGALRTEEGGPRDRQFDCRFLYAAGVAAGTSLVSLALAPTVWRVRFGLVAVVCFCLWLPDETRDTPGEPPCLGGGDGLRPTTDTCRVRPTRGYG